MELIYRHFNIMCSRLEDYIDRVYLSDIRMKESELVALQSQINPHFLYNTLESIRMKAVLEQESEVAKMIYVLAHFFRMTVKNKEIILKIHDEVKYCRTYLELHKIRYGERLQVEFDINEDVLSYGTIKLILQPLVENAILYGFSHSDKPLHIKVSGRIEKETIMFVVEDDGVGMTKEILESIRSELLVDSKIVDKGHSGLKSVHDRIRLVFGHEYGISIDSIVGEGTVVTIVNPLMKVKEMKEYKRLRNSPYQ